MLRISFAVCVHNEGECINELLNQLHEHIERNDLRDEIVILDDNSDDPDTIRILESYSDLPYVQLHRRALERDFGAHKSYLNTLCSGDYIFQIDADEMLSSELLENLNTILKENSEVDLFYIPRVNTVEGLTEEYIKEWNWKVSTLDSYVDEKVLDDDSTEYLFLKHSDLIIEENLLREHHGIKNS